MSLFLVPDYHKIEADWKPGIYMQGKSIQRLRATDSATVLYLSGVILVRSQMRRYEILAGLVWRTVKNMADACTHKFGQKFGWQYQKRVIRKQKSLLYEPVSKLNM